MTEPESSLVEFGVGAFEHAVNILNADLEEMPWFAREWRIRAMHRLHQRLDHEFRGGRHTRLESEQAALNFIQELGGHLTKAADALDYAAHTLKHGGIGLAASKTKEAANAARAVADGLVHQ